MTDDAPGKGRRIGSFEVVRTFAGHCAVLDHETREVMHPVVGPVRESEQLYVGPSRLVQRLRDARSPGSLVLLDVGLGAGSNALAAIRARLSLGAESRPLQIISFDRTADALRLALAPEHAIDFGITPALHTLATALLRDGGVEVPELTWRLVLGELPGTLAGLADGVADIAYWDPFSPRQNPALWGLGAFSALRRVCRPGATVHTYSGATAVRSALLLAGFFVGLGEPLGANKRATVAATERAALAEPLTTRFVERLGRSSAALPGDAPDNALQCIAAHPQLALHG
jgi:queuine tRNA-ribosyltransferase